MADGCLDERSLRVVVEALGSELRATESALAHWRAHASRLHAALRAQRHAPDESHGAPRSLLPVALTIRARPREHSGSSLASFASTSTFRGRRSPPEAAPSASAPLAAWLTREFWDPKEAEALQRRAASAALLQAAWRGLRQRRWYETARAFFAIVNGAHVLTSGGRSVPAYTVTVVRGGHCWQVAHRFSDWLELDKQLACRMPPDAAALRPALPSRFPFRSRSLTSHRSFALNTYLQGLLPLVTPHTLARRTLLNFLSRSHLHWTYADDAVLLAPLTAVRLEDTRAEHAREVAQRMVFTDASGGGGANGHAPPPANSPAVSAPASARIRRVDDVRDASTGGTSSRAVLGQ